VTQRKRSPFENLGCGRRRAKTTSCCRKARFSKSRSQRVRKERTKTPDVTLRRRSMAALYHRKHNRVTPDGVLARDNSPPSIARVCSNDSWVLFRSPTPRWRTRRYYGLSLRPPPATHRRIRGLPVLVHEASRRVWGFRLRRVDKELAISPPAMLPFTKSKASAP
jgi:hypothetical protein